MEQQAQAKKKTKQDKKTKITNAYREHILLHGEKPTSVFAFCKDLKIKEADFYEYFNDFEQIADSFWIEKFKESREALENSAEFAQFTARDKFLSFYFSFFENLKNDRSYALLHLKNLTLKNLLEGQQMKELKKHYKSWAQQLIIDAKNRDEISGRSSISNTYDDLLWYQFLFLLDYWKKDRSRGFEKTDEAIEKAVNFGFDLMEKNAIDSAFEFGKFMFQNR